MDNYGFNVLADYSVGFAPNQEADENYDQIYVMLKGNQKDIEKVYVPFVSAEDVPDDFKKYQELGFLDKEKNIFCFVDAFEACTSNTLDEELSVNGHSFWSSIEAWLKPLTSSNKNVSFFIFTTFSVKDNHAFDGRGVYACSYSIFENSARKEGDEWVLANDTSINDDQDRNGEEAGHNTAIFDCYHAYIVQRWTVWEMEGTNDAREEEARKLLEEAKQKADKANVPFVADYETEDEDDTPLDIAMKRIELCRLDSVSTGAGQALDLSSLDLSDDDFDEIGSLNHSTDHNLGLAGLDLSENPLTYVPNAVEQVVWFNPNPSIGNVWPGEVELNLSYTEITELPNWLGLGYSFNVLNLTNTPVTKLPPGLAEKVKSGAIKIIGFDDGNGA